MPIHGYPGNVITANPVAPTSTVATGVWTTEQQLKAVAAGNWPLPGPPQPISRSLRFNSADSAYLNRTLGTSNRRTFTFSAWLKRSLLASTQCVFGNINYAGGGSTNQQFFLGFTGSDQLDMFHYNNGTQNQVTSTAVYRDPSAWYHIVGAVDTTQATSSNRLKIYVNGSQITTLTTATYPTQNTDTFINANLATGIGRQEGTGISGSYFFSGYQTEIYFIDGQALTPSSFGQTNASTGVWEPIAYTGTYGTNGFYLNFSDNSNTTAATLGKDSSGNGNNWTPNNFSVTAGAGNDSLVDSPTSYGTDTGVGGEVRGNYCTLTPLVLGSLTTLSNGNLQAAFSNWNSSLGTMAFPTTGKWYYEVLVSSTEPLIGIAKNDSLINSAVTTYFTQNSTSYGYYTGGSKHTGPGNSSTSYGASFTSGDLIGVALDSDNGTLTFYKNGSSQGTAFTSLVGPFLPVVGASNGSLTVNFGQRAFAYTAPSGFKALCTQNLPTPTIGATSTTQANDYFDVSLYTGNGTSQSITNSGSMQPDLVWLKIRSANNNHAIYDAIRGVRNLLSSSTSNAEYSDAAGYGLTAFNNNGFTLGADTATSAGTNTNGYTFVAWQWNAGGSTVTNTSGTISAQVRANTTSGFSIVTYTGTGSAATIGHGLGVAPSMIIVKNRQAANSWAVYHISTGANQQLLLNSTNGISSDTQGFTAVPSSTVFSVGTGASMDTNQTSGGGQHVAYCFAAVAGYSAFGSYTGNGSTDGPFVYTGFRPEFVMIKGSSFSGGNWLIWDTVRATYNAASPVLFANLSNAEDTAPDVDILSNGFKLRTTSNRNTNGETYIYAAFAESPFKYALAR